MSTPDDHYGFAAEEAARKEAFNADEMAITQVIADLHDLQAGHKEITEDLVTEIETTLKQGGDHFFRIGDDIRVSLNETAHYAVFVLVDGQWEQYESPAEPAEQKAA